MNQPVVGITASALTVESGPGLGGEKFFAGKGYIDAVGRAGGCPVILPFGGGAGVAGRHLVVADAILLSGGGDVDPWLYGEEPRPGLGRVCPERDEYEIALVRLACELGKPVLGICRGMQVINVALGGTLHQDVRCLAGALQHFQEAGGQVAGHSVQIKAGSLLHRLVGGDTLRTNSFHNQAVKALAAGLTACARSADGVLEALEGQTVPLLAVQWHPEGMCGRHPVMLELFRWLVRAAH